MTNLPEIINLSEVVKILEARGVVAQSDQSHPGSRVAKRGAWAVPRQLTDDERSQIIELATCVGVSILPIESRDLEQSEIDALISEVAAVKDSEDIVKGRYEAIRTAVFNAMNERNLEADEPEFVPVEIYSPDTGKKFVREVRGGKPFVIWMRLNEVVPPTVWDRIARKVVTKVSVYKGSEIVSVEETESWIVDDDEVLAAIQDGSITLDHIQEITEITSKICYFHLKAMGAADKEYVGTTA